ncbi:hypothetical protein STENM327S_01057 [Streptomyces tendae]
MTATDPALTALSQGSCALSLLHGRIEAHIERALQAGHDLSVREYSLLDVLSRQHDGDGGHLQMEQGADAVILSQSATTRWSPGSRTGACSSATCAPPTGAASTPTSPRRACGCWTRRGPPMTPPSRPSTRRPPTPTWHRWYGRWRP